MTFTTFSDIINFFPKCLICDKDLPIYSGNKWVYNKKCFKIKDDIISLDNYKENINNTITNIKLKELHKKCKTCHFMVSFTSKDIFTFDENHIEFAYYANKIKYHYTEYFNKPLYTTIYVNNIFQSKVTLNTLNIQNFSQLKRKIKTIVTFS